MRCRSAARSADTVILHQVLHYAQQPAAAIAEAARLLGAGGRLLIVDFAAHDHEELRTRDAHARLGFDDEQIAGWFDGGGAGRRSARAARGRRADGETVARRGDPRPRRATR